MTYKLLLALLTIALGAMAVGSSMSQITIINICGPVAKDLCGESVRASAVTSVVVTTAALAGASIIAWLLFRAQSQRDDERHKRQNERLDSIERKIDKILGKDVDKKPDEE